MRKIESSTITNAVKDLCAKSNYNLPDDVLKSVNASIFQELGVSRDIRDILEQIADNAAIAKKEKIPLCQDTGTANFFVKLGKDVYIEDGNIYDAINKGVVLGYVNNYLRKSIVSDPIERKNTMDNTPSNIYIDIISGDKIEITFLPKGGGSENASALKMLTPSVGWEGVKEFTLNVVKDKGRDACPPLIVGVGIGGDFASVGLLSKRTLLREIGSVNKNTFYAKKEQELFSEINKLNIGPMGMGGSPTVFAVFIATKATHIASLPVAVSIQCHSCRRMKISI
ncbi:MAG: fumarate hydratase [Endomicrobium sp.]|nr:fumarate hydratase [Endomicrobium sp.]